MNLFAKHQESDKVEEVIFIDKDTHIQGDIKAQKIILEGALSGSVWADELIMRKGASINGKVFVKALRLQEGARCNCELHLDDQSDQLEDLGVISVRSAQKVPMSA